jgi:hypothetical protein
MPAAVAAALREHLRSCPPGPDGLLFSTYARKVLNPANWRQRIWRPLVRTAPGIPPGTTFHQLRHAYASLLSDAGLPDHDVQLRLGHAHPARSAGTAIPTPTRETARPPATPSTLLSRPPDPAASRQQSVDFVDGKVDQPRAAQRAAFMFSQVTGHARVRRQGLEPRTRGLRVRFLLLCEVSAYTGGYHALPVRARRGRDGPSHNAGLCRALTGRTGAAEQTTSNQA